MIILSLRIAVVVLLTLALAAALRRAPAALRHSLWLSAIVCLSLLPFLPALLPSLEMRVAALPLVTLPLPAAETVSIAYDDAGVPSPAPSSAMSARVPSLALIYVTGVLAILCWMLLGRVALWRMTRRSSGSDVAWMKLLEDEAALAGVSRVMRLRFSAAVRTPQVHGVVRPTILLPADAHSWSDVRKRTVLRHELAHIARGDALSQLLAAAVCAAFWFHPLVWFAARRLRAECEHACDDRVLLLGTSPSSYAECLVEIARLARQPFIAPAAALTMAHPSRLEERIMQIIDNGRRRTQETLLIRCGGLTAAALLVCVVSACSVTRSPEPAPAREAGTTGTQATVQQTATSKVTADTIIVIPRRPTPSDTVHVYYPKAPAGNRQRIDTVLRVTKTFINYNAVVQSSVRGREIWVELIGSGASVGLTSLVAIEHREGRTFFQTPAGISVAGDSPFSYQLVAVQPILEDVQILSADGRTLVGGRSVTMSREPEGDGATMRGSYATTDVSQAVTLPADCTRVYANRDKQPQCWIFQHSALSADNQVLPRSTSPQTLRGGGPFRIRAAVRESDFPAAIRALRRGS